MKKKYRNAIIWTGTLAIFLLGYFMADHYLYDGLKPKQIHQDGFQAEYFAQENIEGKRNSILLIGGGQWGDYWASEFAKRGFVGLSLPYTRREGLPDLPEEINLEYFEKALLWLQEQAAVNPEKIIVMGASRNAELALLIASIFPDLVHGVVAYAPSSVSWANRVLPYNSDELKASWKYQGADIPYVPMDKVSGNETSKIETLSYWEKGLAKTDEVARAMIKVENINGPILLFSGKDDQVWPSSYMADMIEQRIRENNFEHSFQNIQYENAGHLISSNPDANSDFRKGQFNIDGKDYEFELGGTKEGDRIAKEDAKQRLLEFIENI